MITVFISSTSKDLEIYRASVLEACRNSGFNPIGMENFMARDEGAVEACIDEVIKTDLFVGIYAWRYGYIPEGSDYSITELEYRAAVDAGKTVFCFLVEPDFPWPKEFVDEGLAARALKGFKETIDTSHVRSTFNTPDDLSAKVSATLAQWIQREQPPARPVVEGRLRQQQQAIIKIRQLERDIEQLEIQRAHLIRSIPDRQLGQRTNIYILTGTLFLCTLGAAMTQNALFGLIVLFGGGWFFFQWFNTSYTNKEVHAQEIHQLERNIRDKRQEINLVESEIERNRG